MYIIVLRFAALTEEYKKKDTDAIDKGKIKKTEMLSTEANRPKGWTQNNPNLGRNA